MCIQHHRGAAAALAARRREKQRKPLDWAMPLRRPLHDFKTVSWAWTPTC